MKFTCVWGRLWKSTLRSKDKLNNIWTFPHDGQQKAILRLLDHLTTWTSCNQGSYWVWHYCKVLTSRLGKRLGSEDKVWKMVIFFYYNPLIRPCHDRSGNCSPEKGLLLTATDVSTTCVEGLVTFFRSLAHHFHDHAYSRLFVSWRDAPPPWVEHCVTRQKRPRGRPPEGCYWSLC